MPRRGGYYEQYWTQQGFNPPPNLNPFLDEGVARFGRAGKRVADLGCGDARTLGDRFLNTDADYVGVDISRTAVESAAKRGVSVRLVPDIAETDLPANSFDAVFIIEVLEHLIDPGAAVAEARRILKPEGELRITVPNAAVWPRRVELLLFGRTNLMGDDRSRDEPWRDPHIRAFTTTSLKGLVEAGGFEDITVAGTEPVSPVRAAGPWLAGKRPSVFARRCTAVCVK